jgi:hypothetical protein
MPTQAIWRGHVKKRRAVGEAALSPCTEALPTANIGTDGLTAKLARSGLTATLDTGLTATLAIDGYYHTHGHRGPPMERPTTDGPVGSDDLRHASSTPTHEEHGPHMERPTTGSDELLHESSTPAPDGHDGPPMERPTTRGNASSQTRSDNVCTVRRNSCQQGTVDYLTIDDLVQASGQPNFKGSRVPLPSTLNMEAWRAELHNYTETALCDFLEFGRPTEAPTSCEPARSHDWPDSSTSLPCDLGYIYSFGRRPR